MDLKGFFMDVSPERVVQRAQKLAAKGKTEQAVEAITSGIEKLGESADLRIEQAGLLLSMGRARQAADAVRALLKAEPSETDRVAGFIESVRGRYPECELLHEALAEGLIARRRFKEALDRLEKIDRNVLRTDLEARLANLNRFLESGATVPRSAAPALWFGAVGFEAIDDWKRALDCHRKILASIPTDLDAVEERIRALILRHHKVTALRLAFAEILSAHGRKDAAVGEYVTVLEQDKRCAPQVIRILDAAREASPDDHGLAFACVKARLATGEISEALAACDPLIDANAYLREIEGILNDLAGDTRGQAASRLIEARLSVRQGKAARAVAAIAGVFSGGSTPRSVEVLREVIEAFPEEARPRQILAEQLLRSGQVDESLATYRIVRKLDPASGPLIISQLQAALGTDPGHPGILSLLEECCTEGGDVDAAVPFLRRRLREQPETAAAVLDRLRTLSLTAPEHRGVKTAIVEACLATGDPQGAWDQISTLVTSETGPDRATLHLLVLAAGDSEQVFRNAADFIERCGPEISGLPEVIFALAEAASRLGLLGEAVARFGRAASVCPEAAALCHEAIRDLAKSPVVTDDEDRAILAEALVDTGDVEGVSHVLAATTTLTPVAASRLIRKLESALRAEPADGVLSDALARVYLATGQIDAALEATRAALGGEETPVAGRLAVTYGDAAARKGDLREAVRAWVAAVKRDPERVVEVVERLRRLISIDMSLDTAHLALGRLLISQGVLAEGISSILTSASIKPDLAPVVLKDLEVTARKFPGDPSVNFARSGLLFNAGDPAGAARCVGAHLSEPDAPVDEILARLEGIAGRYPECAPALLELGRAYLYKGWSERAAQCLQRTHELDPTLLEPVLVCLAEIETSFPDEPSVHHVRATIYEREGRPLPAGESWLRAVELGAWAAEALEGIERLCSRSGENTETGQRLHLIRMRACVVAGAPDEALEAGDQLLESGSGCAAEVLEVIERIVEARPDDAAARLARARCLLRLMKIEEATGDLRIVMDRDPGRAAEVTRLARAVVERHRSLVPASRLLADALEAIGDDREACRVLDRLLATLQGQADPGVLFARRSLAVKLGDRETERAMLERIESMTGGGDELLTLLHDEAAARRRCATPDPEEECVEAIRTGRFEDAIRGIEAMPASPFKAWVLERCGRDVEAAACLDEVHPSRGAAASAALHDRMVCRQLEGRSVALMAEAPIHPGPGSARAVTAARETQDMGCDEGGLS